MYVHKKKQLYITSNISNIEKSVYSIRTKLGKSHFAKLIRRPVEDWANRKRYGPAQNLTRPVTDCLADRKIRPCRAY